MQHEREPSKLAPATPAPLHTPLRIPYPAAMSDWRNRLWAEVVPYLPAGRVALWAAPETLPATLDVLSETLLVRTALDATKPPKGTAFNALVVVASGTPPLPWDEFLQALAPLAGPQAPLLLLVPRTGLVALHQTGWENPHPATFWENTLRSAGWGALSSTYVGGCAWPHPWASAACRLYVAQRRGGGGGVRIQFKRKTSAAGTASTKPLPC